MHRCMTVQGKCGRVIYFLCVCMHVCLCTLSNSHILCIFSKRMYSFLLQFFGEEDINAEWASNLVSRLGVTFDSIAPYEHHQPPAGDHDSDDSEEDDDEEEETEEEWKARHVKHVKTLQKHLPLAVANAAANSSDLDTSDASDSEPEEAAKSKSSDIEVNTLSEQF